MKPPFLKPRFHFESIVPSSPHAVNASVEPPLQPFIDAGRIAVRPLVDFLRLQAEMAAVDVNIVPLERARRDCLARYSGEAYAHRAEEVLGSLLRT